MGNLTYFQEIPFKAIFIILPQVFPDNLTQGKNQQMSANFLDDNFEYFRVSTARRDVRK